MKITVTKKDIENGWMYENNCPIALATRRTLGIGNVHFKGPVTIIVKGKYIKLPPNAAKFSVLQMDVSCEDVEKGVLKPFSFNLPYKRPK